MTPTALFKFNTALYTASDALDMANYTLYNKIMARFTSNRKFALRRKLVSRGHGARIVKAEGML